MSDKYIDKTIDYYNRHADAFCADTQEASMSEQLGCFLDLIPAGGKVLDAGCGSGRDSLAMMQAGYEVDAFDASEAMCRHASELIGKEVRLCRFEAFGEESQYDGIWACASLLHVKPEDMADVIRRLARALKPAGILYASFKKGEGECYRGERRFTDADEGYLRQLLTSDFEIIEITESKDVRPDRADETWINVYARCQAGARLGSGHGARLGSGHEWTNEGLPLTVIFDLDGTLIDTEKFYRVCWPMALAEFGYHMTDAQSLSMRSLGRPFAPVHLKAMFGESIDYVAVRERRKELMEAMLAKEGIHLKKGCRELLAYMKAHGIQAAIATASDLERTRRYLSQVGILDDFTHLISATMVAEGKPSPDVYLYACETLGLAPKDCFAVEDSPNGVLSASRAGCKVIMVPDQDQPNEAIMNRLYAKVDDLSQIIAILEGLR